MAYLNGKEIYFTAGAAGITSIDSEPREKSGNPVSSEGVYKRLNWETVYETVLSESTSSFRKKFDSSYSRVYVRFDMDADTSGFAEDGRVNGSVFQGEIEQYVFSDQGAWLLRNAESKILSVELEMKGNYCCTDLKFYSTASNDMTSYYLISGAGNRVMTNLGKRLTGNAIDGVSVNFTVQGYPIPAGTRITVLGIRK